VTEEKISPLLTIAIPTYNRNDKVKRIVEILLPQLKGYAQLVIFDNCSNISVEYTVKDYLLKDNIRVVRNDLNIGMSGNFIKCFEYCNTEWLWVLGDDDYPYANAVETVINNLFKWPDASFLNFNSFMAPGRSQDIAFLGAKELVRGLDSFGNLLCISLGLYNANKLCSGLRFAYQYAYTVAPQIAYLLTGLKDGQALLLNDELINFAAHDTDPGELWSWVSLSSVIGSLAELPLNLDEEAYKIFSGHLLTHIQRPEQLYGILLSNSYYTPKEKLRYFKLIYDRSTFGRLICERTPSFIKYYIKLWIYSLRNRQANKISDDYSHYKRIERI